MATQRDWLKPNQSKQYCANEIAKMVTMGSRAQYVTYRAFTAGSEKAPYTRGEVFRGHFKNTLDTHEYTAKTWRYSGKKTAGQTTITLKWTPVLDATCILKMGATTYVDIGGGKFYPESAIASVEEVIDSNGFIKREYTLTAGATQANITLKPGTTNDGNFDSSKITADTNKIFGELSGTVISGAATDTAYTVEYQYNNEYVPQNDIPLINMVQKGITLEAEEHQVGIYYNLFAEFEAKNDYSISLGDDLADQAKFELAYDVDVAVVKAEIEAATTATKDADGNTVDNATALTDTWYAGMRTGVSQRDHYASIYDTILQASANFFTRTNKYEPTFMLVHPLDRRFLVYIPEWKAKTQRFGVGPFVAGEIDGKTVICTPIVDKGTVIMGTNTPDVFACIYGTYMPIIQTQLLGYADGGMSQGFARMDAIKIVNPYLLGHFDISEAVGSNVNNVVVTNTTTNPVYTQEVNG